MKYLTIILLLFLTQCHNDDPIACTEIYVYGLNVTVRDADTNNLVLENITVTATDGEYVEELMITDGFDTYIGAGERPGNYIIEISGPDYQTFTSEVINVGADECHVIGEVLEFIIQPN